MKGLVLKVKLIYVISAWSQSCSVIFRECDSDAKAERSPYYHPPQKKNLFPDMTVNK